MQSITNWPLAINFNTDKNYFFVLYFQISELTAIMNSKKLIYNTIVLLFWMEYFVTVGIQSFIYSFWSTLRL